MENVCFEKNDCNPDTICLRKGIESDHCMISVIIPVYQSAEYLEETFQSLQEQTIHDAEIICIDDSSTDGSPEMLLAFAELPAGEM